MPSTAWSRLTAKGKARLRKSGVNPASYNAYARKSKAQKAKVNRDDFVRGKTKVQKTQSTRRQAIKTQRQKVIEHLTVVLRGRGSKKGITRGVRMMTPDELDIAENADYETIADMASRPPDESRGRNPFWYG